MIIYTERVEYRYILTPISIQYLCQIVMIFDDFVIHNHLKSITKYYFSNALSHT